MEEDSGTVMETDVSSTTEDVVEAQSGPGPRVGIETSVSIESIKEESVSPKKNVNIIRLPDKPRKSDGVEASKSPPTPKLVQLKKIVIKSSNKTYHIQKPAIFSTTKPDGLQCVVTKDAIVKPPQSSQSPTKQSKDVVDSSSKPETLKASDKGSTPESPSKVPATEVQAAEKSPNKVIASQESGTDLNIESPKVISEAEKAKTPPTEQETKVSPSKELVVNLNKPKELVVNLNKPKELVVNLNKPKEQVSEETPTKEQSGKTPPSTPNKVSVPKDEPQKQTSKEQPKTLIFIRKESLSSVPEKHDNEKSSDKNEDSLISAHSSSITSTPVPEEASNDSQMETNSESSEKDSNKSISRELKSLIKSAKESKIINECTQLTSKTRKSRTLLDNSSTSLNATDVADKIQGVRRGSNNSQISNCSEKSDKGPVKRSMRSQNPEFVTKVKQFLSSVADKEDADEESEIKTKDNDDNLVTSTPKKKKEDACFIQSYPAKKLRSDTYCWRCHWLVEPGANEKVLAPMQCTVCPRSYHYKCLSVQERNKIHANKSWVCPECMLVLQAENSDSRSPAMKKISLGMLCELLKYALERMKDVNGVEPFLQAVDRSAFPDYDSYVVHPMDLSLMESHIHEGLYGSTEAFLADAHWILHNSVIFNTLQSKLTGGARALVRSCRAEMGEIEACPECYAAAHARRPTWFTDVCSSPHILLWAKLKGFPYWPAKGMTVNTAGLVDVRFFGQHDRAWVPARDCFLYSEKDPNNFRTKRQDLLDSMQEAEQHIRNISRKYGKFVYPPFRTPFDPAKLNEQLKMMIPSFEGEVRTQVNLKQPSCSPSTPKDKSRSNSKSSKGSHLDGDVSEGEDTSRSSSQTRNRNLAEDDHSDKDKTMAVDESMSKGKETRKRHAEEVSIPIVDIAKEKKKRVEASDKTAENPSTVNKEAAEKATVAKEHKDGKDSPAKKDAEPSPSKVADKKQAMNKQNTIKVISIAKILKTAIKTDNKDAPKQKPKSNPNDKGTPTAESTKAQKRRISRTNKSLNSSTSGNDNQTDSTPTKVTRQITDKKVDTDKTPTTSDKSSAKDRLPLDDDVTLANLAKKDGNKATPRAMKSILRTSSSETTPKTNSMAKPAGTTVEAHSESSVFTPTSTDNVRNMKEAVDKLQKLRSESDPPVLVGRVGVRAFARMTSPPKDAEKNVQVEIKAEPMDYDDADRQMEKMDLMNAITLKPVNPQNNLREVRINKVVVGPVPRKPPSKPVEIRPKAKKTFPQPKKPEEARSELTSKNSMVYIPIQPPMTQAPVRVQRPTNGPTSTPPAVSRAGAANTTSTANNAVNTVTTPLVGMPALSSPSATPSTVAVPTVGQVPTVGNTVHTVPLITSVNGQWTFSLQPMMSVGGVDSTKSPPMVNGVGDRPSVLTTQASPVTAPGSGPLLTPIAPAVRISTDNPPREPPRLQLRPGLTHPLDGSAPTLPVPAPSNIGPLTAKISQNALKLSDYFRSLLEESIVTLEDAPAQLTATRLQLEQVRWRHQQEIDEMKHNHELTLAEMRASFDKEKARLLAEARRAATAELEAAVKHAKSKQWCAKCSQEAQFYCCWNTSYCDYPCQRAHWVQHYAVCTQQRTQDNNEENATPSESRLQSAPETLPKTTAAPNLTVGGKLAPSRVYTQEIAPKPSIIMSMVEEGGTQTMKCVGTYKPPSTTTIAPLIINKQMLNSEEASKKVVTSGGYLIVGAANAPNATTSAGTVATPTRRVQYFS